MDRVAEFLTAIRNSGNARLEKVDLPASRLRVGIAQILQDAGFIRSYKVAKDSKQGIMRIYLRYDEQGKPAISDLTRVSRSGRRLYVTAGEIPSVRSNLGTSIVSTSQGVMDGKIAKTKNLGGELLCTVW